jgi:hypothetical protein
VENKKIENMEQLKSEAKNGLDCSISLNGCLRSSKHIWYDEDSNEFEIISLIDGSEQRLTPEEMMDKNFTNIGDAIQKGSLIKDL